MTLKTIGMLAFAAALLSSAPALAATAQPDAPRAFVDIRPFALDTPDGRNQLRHALRLAARQVCVVDDDLRTSRDAWLIKRDCMTHALASAHRQLAMIIRARAAVASAPPPFRHVAG